MMRTLLSAMIGGVLLMVMAVSGGVAYLIADKNLPPRLLAEFLPRLESTVGKVANENRNVLELLRQAEQLLTRLDRGVMSSTSLSLPLLPSVYAADLPTTKTSKRMVSTAAELINTIHNAQPGDVITLAPGRYAFTGRAIPVERAGLAAARITVRAERPGSVQLDFDMLEGFHVLAPYWTFENLTIRGICASHSDCEHAFHVVGSAHDFIARNNGISDFNAHFKINGERGAMPDNGRLEGNTLSNTSARHTSNPVTPIDLVAASGWRVVGNRISDFIKDGGDRVSYGAFVKGAGSDNRIEKNIVICERQPSGQPGSRVGLSLGGGGSTQAYCRDGLCKVEQDQSLIQSNLIASCSDVGVYINRSAHSRVVHNTLIDTAGIDVRFPESSAEIEGNLVDGVIRSRDGGALTLSDNYPTSLARLYVGSHPVRGLFRDASQLDFSWIGQPPRRGEVKVTPPDLCGAARPAQPAYGAFEDFSMCRRLVD